MRRNWINFAVPAIVAVALAVWFLLPGKPPKPDPDAGYFHWVMRELPPDQVNLLAMGDWGDGGPGQDQVAAALTRHVQQAGIQFHGLLSAGDNFYVPIDGTRDAYWRTLFEEKYDPKVINFPFYCVLGNHDHEGDLEDVELAYARKYPRSRFKMPGRHYRVDFPSERPIATLLALDSTKPKISKKDWEEQIEWMEKELGSITDGRWVIVMAHHPPFSNGPHGDNATLQKDWGPLLQRHKVDFLVNGHDHNLQHLEIDGWPTSFLIVGGGGRPFSAPRSVKHSPFSRKLYGFAHLKLEKDRAEVRFIDAASGQVVHQFQRTKAQPVQIVSTTGKDVPIFDPVASVKGLTMDEWADVDIGLDTVKNNLPDWRKLVPTRPATQPAP